jgi:hypothetical protein
MPWREHDWAVARVWRTAACYFASAPTIDELIEKQNANEFFQRSFWTNDVHRSLAISAQWMMGI